ncbi:HPr family phosphocarrier protein [Marinospirillum alkaliphilum]|uniref:Phosphocarrier protein NPr n=1 Tax=Marinospirillum alkaliphilum DSM 21637 TaxID=1122209 RepID=A0A1K1TNV8_9GAMM|nr:HPr family phosphocarrier protein [Marinospirillum alkaliphilum]SFX01981.1 phosphocarrier protein NPr [Marinospirillum alkaliphilum DSM 21637]
MQEKKVTLINKRGLHARAATRVVQVCQQFQSQTEICLGERTANTRNIMQLLMLAAPCGTQLSIRANGEDENQAIEALEQLILDRFDEEE